MYKTIKSEFDYIQAMKSLINIKNLKDNRTGIKTYADYNYTFDFDLSTEQELPILIGKHTALKGALVEIIWIMKGLTDNKFLTENGVKYWSPWVKEDGTFGPVYGHQMRNFNGKDQLLNLIEGFEMNFLSRRHLISLWNPNDLKDMALPPCHFLYNFTTHYNPITKEKYFNLHVIQRSGDSFIGIPYDLLMFMYMMKIIGFVTGVEGRNLFLTVTDFHLYENHVEALTEYEKEFQKNFKTISKPVNIKWKDFVINEFLENGRPTIDSFLDFIVMNNFNVFEFKNKYDENWEGTKNLKKIKVDVAV